MSRILFTTVLCMCLLVGCGAEAQEGDTRSHPGPEAAAPQTAPDTPPEEHCDETTDLKIAFSDKETVPVGAFAVTHTAGFIAGMRYNGKSTAKLAYVVLANYKPKLTRYNLDPPKEAGQVALMLTFKTESKTLPFAKQNEEYAKMAVPAATYQPGWMKQEASYQVAYYLGDKSGGGPAISDDATGEATLTHSTPNLVCGRIDFTSPAGTTIKGTFSVKIEKDMWAK